MSQSLCDRGRASQSSRHRRQFSCGNRHAKKTHRKCVKTLRIIQSHNGALTQEAREERINKSTDLDHASTHEYRQKVCQYLFHVCVCEIERRTKLMNQPQYDGQLHCKLERTA